MEEHISSETRCKNPACQRLLTQTGGGHRKREYCDDACRQAARRHRVEQAHREEVARRWATFTPETRSFLDWITTRYSYGKDLADAVELAVHREIDRYSTESSAQFEPALAALREKQLSRVEKLKARILQLEQELAECKQRLAEQPQPRSVLSAEQARERAGLHGYLDGSYLDSTQRLFVRVFQSGQVEPNEMREVIHQERGAEADHLRQHIAELEQELQEREQRSPIEEQNIRCIEHYAIDCSLDAGQAKERIGALEQELADASQGRDQVQARFAEYVRSTNEKLSELTGELAKLKQEQERAAGQENQHNIDAYQEKLTQAGRRISKLEQQVEIQRQRLGWYYQRLYPSSLAVAEERLLALGAALGYKRLLKYNDLTVEVASGVEAWREFATHANIDDLALAIEQAQRFYENLEATRSPAKRDNQVDHG